MAAKIGRLFTTQEKGIKVEGRRMKPTKSHRPAIWECMLGTVFAQNDEGEIKYFDYDWDKAVEFSGYSPDRDPRLFRYKIRHFSYPGSPNYPSYNQIVLFIKELVT